MQHSDPAAIRAEREKKLAKQVGLADIVKMCDDCIRVCKEKTARFVDDSTRPAKGYETEYAKFARERREYEMDKCVPHCELVQEVCPKAEMVQRYEDRFYGPKAHKVEDVTVEKPKEEKKGWFGFGGGGKKVEERPKSHVALTKDTEEHLIPHRNQMRRCEHAVERWTQQLFNMATKPSKIEFNVRDPKSGENYDPLTQKKLEEGEKRTDVTSLVLANAGSSTASGKPAAHLGLDVDDDKLMAAGGSEGIDGEQPRKTQRWAMMLRAKHDTSFGGSTGAAMRAHQHMSEHGDMSEEEKMRAYQRTANATDAASMLGGDGIRAALEGEELGKAQGGSGTTPRW